MNDDFLHRLRKTPSPEFLAALKMKLDRQPPVARSPGAGFVRGVLVGFLVASAAFAVASVSITGLPTSASQFFNAPIDYVARTFLHGDSTEQDADRNPVKAVPLGPAWYPTHVNPQPASATASESVRPAAASGTSTAGTQGTSPGGGAPVRNFDLVVGAPKELAAFTRATLPATALGYRTRLVEESAESGLTSLCKYVDLSPEGHPNIIEVDHRISADQQKHCTYLGHSLLTEIPIGYQAVSLFRSKLYAPLSLTARDVFLALARRVPDPAHPQALIDNPYTRWSQIDPALPEDPIHFIGPARDSPEGQDAATLLLQPGCNTYPWLASFHVSVPGGADAAAFDSACRRFREDSAYEEVSPSSAFTYINELNTRPTTFGIFSVSGSESLANSLAVNPIDGTLPEHASLAAHTYPASRALYVYMRASDNPWRPFGVVAASLMSNSLFKWGFVTLDSAEQAATQRILDTF